MTENRPLLLLLPADGHDEPWFGTTTASSISMICDGSINEDFGDDEDDDNEDECGVDDEDD